MQLSEAKARDVLEVIRAVGRILIKGVNELRTYRQKGITQLPPPRESTTGVTMLVPRARGKGPDNSKLGVAISDMSTAATNTAET